MTNKLNNNLRQAPSTAVKNSLFVGFIFMELTSKQNYTDLAKLYESVGDIKNQLTNLRKAIQILVYDTPKSVIASLKKLQYFNFEKDELGLLPPTVVKDSGNPEEVDLGFERACLVYYLASLTQNR